jgi:hypothetical protein
MKILDAPAIDHGWWRRVTEGAKSGEPHHKTMAHLHISDFAQALMDAQGVDTGEEAVIPLPDIPGDLDGVDENQLPISQDEALAILSRFLTAERGEFATGAEILPLHWLVLCGAYCPGRERYAVLREFVNIGYLRQKNTGTEYVPSSLVWPLIVMPERVRAIETLLYVRKYVPDLYAVNRRAGMIWQHIPFLRWVANAGVKLLTPSAGS